MDVNVVSQLVSSLGFPIVMCIVLIYYMMNNTKELTNAIDDLRTAISVLIDKPIEKD